jgi:uncharacterized protein (DUF1800 family)
MATENDLAHLARRMGFGARSDQLRALSALSREQIVDQWLDSAITSTRVGRPSLLSSGAPEWPKTVNLRQWWYDQMSSTPTPLVEKMTLFWHGHFCSSHDKAGGAENLWAQNDLFRRFGLGNVRQLTQQMALQPAMLRYLDNASNVKGAPNENFSRELWELFLLGPNNYTQSEVAASARAWTGYNVVSANGLDRFAYNSAAHDDRPSTIFGVTKAWKGPEVIDATFDNPVAGRNVARWLSRKWWEFFAYQGPTDQLIDQFATVLITNRWEIAPVLRAMFKHQEFWSQQSRHGRLRSPVEYVVSVARILGVDATKLQPDWFASQMGQELFNPPDVSGWRLNDAWLTTGSYWGRAGIADIAVSMLFAEKAITGRFAAIDLRGSGSAIDDLAAYFGITRGTLSTSTRQSVTNWRSSHLAAEKSENAWGGFLMFNLVKLILLSPEFQIG